LAGQLKQAMRNVACTVYVITLVGVGRRWGLTATAVSSLSLEPPSILVCVNRNASIHAPLMSADRFCLNALRRDQQDVAAVFGAPGLGEERFKTGSWLDFDGAPAIREAVANILCRRVEATCFGSHSILIGQVEAVRTDHRAAPLIYRQGAFGA
jgi:flavin reductase (DIM6/NTAB) family NADH-FMN oxidoreductase RutF